MFSCGAAIHCRYRAFVWVAVQEHGQRYWDLKKIIANAEEHHQKLSAQARAVVIELAEKVVSAESANV